MRIRSREVYICSLFTVKMAGGKNLVNYKVKERGFELTRVISWTNAFLNKQESSHLNLIEVSGLPMNTIKTPSINNFKKIHGMILGDNGCAFTKRNVTIYLLLIPVSNFLQKLTKN